MKTAKGEVKLEKVKSESDLGVIIDSNLNFSQHVAKKGKNSK